MALNSPQKPKYDQNVETLMAAPAPTVEAPKQQSIPLEVDYSKQEPKITEINREVRAPIASMLGTFALGVGITMGVGYAYVSGLGPFKKNETTMPAQSASTIASAAPKSSAKTEYAAPTSSNEIPESNGAIDTPEKLNAALTEVKIQVSESDFIKIAGKNLHMQALVIEPTLDKDNQMHGFKLKPLTAQTTRHAQPTALLRVKDEYTLIATLAVTPGHADRVKYEGVAPAAAVSDSKNPAIKYHLYKCAEENAPKVGSILMTDPHSKRARNLTLYPIQLSSCKTVTE